MQTNAGTSAGQGLLDLGVPRHYFPQAQLGCRNRVSSKGQTEGTVQVDKQNIGAAPSVAALRGHEGVRVRGQEGFRQRGQWLNSEVGDVRPGAPGRGPGPRGLRRQASCR